MSSKAKPGLCPKCKATTILGCGGAVPAPLHRKARVVRQEEDCTCGEGVRLPSWMRPADPPTEDDDG